MKEATGELNMTVITIVAIAAVAGIFYLWVWPSIQVSIARSTCNASCSWIDADGKNVGCEAIQASDLGADFDAARACTKQ